VALGGVPFDGELVLGQGWVEGPRPERDRGCARVFPALRAPCVAAAPAVPPAPAVSPAPPILGVVPAPTAGVKAQVSPAHLLDLPRRTAYAAAA
jgi:hypothetical protein